MSGTLSTDTYTDLTRRYSARRHQFRGLTGPGSRASSAGTDCGTTWIPCASALCRCCGPRRDARCLRKTCCSRYGAYGRRQLTGTSRGFGSTRRGSARRLGSGHSSPRQARSDGGAPPGLPCHPCERAMTPRLSEITSGCNRKASIVKCGRRRDAFARRRGRLPTRTAKAQCVTKHRRALSGITAGCNKEAGIVRVRAAT